MANQPQTQTQNNQLQSQNFQLLTQDGFGIDWENFNPNKPETVAAVQVVHMQRDNAQHAALAQLTKDSTTVLAHYTVAQGQETRKVIEAEAEKTREEIRRTGGIFGRIQSWLIALALIGTNITVLVMVGLFTLIYAGVSLTEVAVLAILWKELNLFPESSRNRQNEGRR